MNTFYNWEKIYLWFKNFKDIEKLLKKLHNNNSELKLPTWKSILDKEFLLKIKEKILKFQNSKISKEELFEINNKKEVENIEMINPEHFFIWVVWPDNNIVTWSVRKLKEEIINEFDIININK